MLKTLLVVMIALLASVGHAATNVEKPTSPAVAKVEVISIQEAEKAQKAAQVERKKEEFQRKKREYIEKMRASEQKKKVSVPLPEKK